MWKMKVLVTKPCLTLWNSLKLHIYIASLVDQSLKNLPAMWETRVRSLGQEVSTGEKNGSSLQYSCLENPMNRGAWQATIYGITRVDTTERIKDRTGIWTLGFLTLYQMLLLVCIHACVLSHLSHVQLCVSLWTVACQAPLFMGFSRQEYWAKLPRPPSRDLLTQGSNCY